MDVETFIEFWFTVFLLLKRILTPNVLTVVDSHVHDKKDSCSMFLTTNRKELFLASATFNTSLSDQ